MIAIDLSLVHDRTAAAVAHGDARRDHGIEGVHVTVDELRTWTPSATRPTPFDEVEQWIAATARDYRDARVVIDSWNAGGMIQRLRKRGIRTTEFTPTSVSVGRLATNLHLLLRNRSLTLPDQAELIDELANVRLVEGPVPGQYRLQHAAGKHDDRAFAVGLAALDIIEHPPHSGPRIRVLAQTAPTRPTASLQLLSQLFG